MTLCKSELVTTIAGKRVMNNNSKQKDMQSQVSIYELVNSYHIHDAEIDYKSKFIHFNRLLM